jgi:hypothetical protein
MFGLFRKKPVPNLGEMWPREIPTVISITVRRKTNAYRYFDEGVEQAMLDAATEIWIYGGSTNQIVEALADAMKRYERSIVPMLNHKDISAAMEFYEVPA